MNQKTNQKNVETNNGIKIDFAEEVPRILFEESLRIPNGFKEEIYFNKERKEISFSSPLTKNSWTDDEEKIGEVQSFSISELEGWKEINDDFVEVNDECNERDPNFRDKGYERFYSLSSIITREEAIERIEDSHDVEDWYEEEKNIVENILNSEDEGGN